MKAAYSLRLDHSGVFVAPATLSALRDAAARAHCAWLEVDLNGVRDKASFLAACARDLDFPPHFGGNWDALADSLGDFSWKKAAGFAIAFKGVAGFARGAPDDCATAIEILRNAAAEWRARNRIFLVLLDRAPPAAGLARFAVARP